MKRPSQQSVVTRTRPEDRMSLDGGRSVHQSSFSRGIDLFEYYYYYRRRGTKRSRHKSVVNPTLAAAGLAPNPNHNPNLSTNHRIGVSHHL